MTAYIDIPTDCDFWGNTATDEEAQRAADALQLVLEEGTDRMNIDAEISLSRRGDRLTVELADSPAQAFLTALNEFAWQHDQVQAAAFEKSPVDVERVLRDYNNDVVARGGQRQTALE